MGKTYFGNKKFDQTYFTGKLASGYPGGYTKENLNRYDYSYTDFAPNALEISRLGIRTYFEIGCACGYLMEELIDLGIKVKGWDISEYIVNQASPRVRPFIEIKSIDEIYSVPDKSFDLVHVSTVLGYQRLNKLDYFLKQIKRIAKRYVIIYCGTPEDAPEEIAIRKINKPDEWWNRRFAKYFTAVDTKERFLWKL